MVDFGTRRRRSSCAKSLTGFRRLLEEHPSIDGESVRVRFVRLGPFSLDIELFGYLLARDWEHSLEIQEQLLFAITDIVNHAGTAIAFPSQMTYVADIADRQACRKRRSRGADGCVLS